MKGFLVGFAATACSLFSPTPGAATFAGTVTDAATGRPIAGATVFVYWGHMVHPHSPVVVMSDWWSCDGTAAAVSDAAGGYEIALPFTTSLHKSGDRAPQMRVVAPGYFDDRVFYERAYRDSPDAVTRSIPLRKHTDSENRWSPSLVPFGGLGIDARVMALELATTEHSIGAQAGYVCERSSANAAYNTAIAYALADALCTNAAGLDPPHAATLQSSLFARPDLPEPSRQRYAFLYRELIQPLVPADTQAIAPHDAYANACAWIRWQRAESNPASQTSDDPITLSIPIVDGDDGSPLAHIPVRVLWGQPPERYAPASGYFSVRRGIVAESDADGRVRLPVSQAMIDEQRLDFSAYNEQLRYAAVPITFDRVNFNSGPVSNDFRLAGRSVLDRYIDHIDGARPADEIERVSSADWSALVNPGDASFARLPLNSPEVWRVPAAVRTWFQLRAREEARQTEATRHPRDTAIPSYRWDWPALPLLWRSTALLAGPVAVESYPDRWASLLRAQFIGTFDRMCHEPFQKLSPRETWQGLQGLWWLETQKFGRPIADERAQRRAVTWDHGIRCIYVGAQNSQRGPSPQAFDTREFCNVWTEERASIDDGTRPRYPPASLDALKPDFSRREEKCADVPNGGAFQ
jgi:hypothetical protein